MADTYYDSELTGEQIEATLNAINGVIDNANNGKVLAIEGGNIVPKSVSEWVDPPVLEPLNVTENGTYTPEGDVDGFNEVTVNVPSEEPILEHLSVTQNGTYTPGTGVDGYDQVEVNVSGGGGGVLEHLSVTQNGVYTPRAGVDGFDQVSVNVSGGGQVIPDLPSEYKEMQYMIFDGTGAYFSIDEQIKPAWSIETKMMIESTRISSSAEKCLIGNPDQNIEVYYTNNSQIRFWTYNASYDFKVNSDEWKTRGTSGQNTPYSVSLDTLNDINLYFTSGNINKFYIGRYSNRDDGWYLGRAYKVIVYGIESNERFSKNINKYLVPCYKISDDTIGFFDRVNGVFYTNQGSGTLLKGPDAN